MGCKQSKGDDDTKSVRRLSSDRIGAYYGKASSTSGYTDSYNQNQSENSSKPTTSLSTQSNYSSVPKESGASLESEEASVQTPPSPNEYDAIPEPLPMPPSVPQLPAENPVAVAHRRKCSHPKPAVFQFQNPPSIPPNTSSDIMGSEIAGIECFPMRTPFISQEEPSEYNVLQFPKSKSDVQIPSEEMFVSEKSESILAAGIETQTSNQNSLPEDKYSPNDSTDSNENPEKTDSEISESVTTHSSYEEDVSPEENSEPTEELEETEGNPDKPLNQKEKAVAIDKQVNPQHNRTNSTKSSSECSDYSSEHAPEISTSKIGEDETKGLKNMRHPDVQNSNVKAEFKPSYEHRIIAKGTISKDNVASLHLRGNTERLDNHFSLHLTYNIPTLPCPQCPTLLTQCPPIQCPPPACPYQLVSAPCTGTIPTMALARTLSEPPKPSPTEGYEKPVQRLISNRIGDYDGKMPSTPASTYNQSQLGYASNAATSLSSQSNYCSVPNASGATLESEGRSILADPSKNHVNSFHDYARSVAQLPAKEPQSNQQYLVSSKPTVLLFQKPPLIPSGASSDIMGSEIAGLEGLPPTSTPVISQKKINTEDDVQQSPNVRSNASKIKFLQENSESLLALRIGTQTSNKNALHKDQSQLKDNIDGEDKIEKNSRMNVSKNTFTSKNTESVLSTGIATQTSHQNALREYQSNLEDIESHENPERKYSIISESLAADSSSESYDTSEETSEPTEDLRSKEKALNERKKPVVITRQVNPQDAKKVENFTSSSDLGSNNFSKYAPQVSATYRSNDPKRMAHDALVQTSNAQFVPSAVHQTTTNETFSKYNIGSMEESTAHPNNHLNLHVTNQIPASPYPQCPISQTPTFPPEQGVPVPTSCPCQPMALPYNGALPLTELPRQPYSFGPGSSAPNAFQHQPPMPPSTNFESTPSQTLGQSGFGRDKRLQGKRESSRKRRKSRKCHSNNNNDQNGEDLLVGLMIIKQLMQPDKQQSQPQQQQQQQVQNQPQQPPCFGMNPYSCYPSLIYPNYCSYPCGNGFGNFGCSSNNAGPSQTEGSNRDGANKTMFEITDIELRTPKSFLGNSTAFGNGRAIQGVDNCEDDNNVKDDD